MKKCKALIYINILNSTILNKSFFIFCMLILLVSSVVNGQDNKEFKVRMAKSYFNLKAKIKDLEIINEARWVLSNNDRYVGHLDLQGHVGSAPLNISNDTIFVANRNSIFCFNGVSGKKYWIKKYPFTGKIWQSKTNIVVAGFEQLKGVNKKTGETVWTDSIHKMMNRKYNRDKNLIFLSNDSLIVGLDAESGKKVWEYNYSIPLHLSATFSDILLGQRKDSLYCIDLNTKKIRWKQKIEKRNRIKNDIDNNILENKSDSILKFDFKNGKILFGNSAKYETKILNLLSISRGIIAKKMGKEEIFLWNLKSGKTIWTYKIPNQETLRTPYNIPLSADKKTLYINTKQGILRAIHLKTGKLLWEFDTYSRITSNLILGDGILYMVNSTGMFIAIDLNLKDGIQKWKNVRDF